MRCLHNMFIMQPKSTSLPAEVNAQLITVGVYASCVRSQLNSQNDHWKFRFVKSRATGLESEWKGGWLNCTVVMVQMSVCVEKGRKSGKDALLCW